MLRKAFLSIVFISTIYLGCKEEEKKTDISTKVNSDSLLTLINKAPELPSHIIDSINHNDTSNLLTISYKHAFSNTNTLDSFSLKLSGKSILEGTLTFSIFDMSGKEIHNEVFEAFNLLFDEGDIIPINKKSDSIIARMKTFFTKERFIQPAIEVIPQYSEDNSDKEIWTEINTDKTAIGFMYNYGYEGTYAIAYSKKKQKAVMYFSSD